MARFITRVELHKANGEDYAVLHKAMIAQKFTTIITDTTTGKRFYLPSAMYLSNASETKIVMNCAKQAAKATGKTFEIITVKPSDTLFHNLKEVKAIR